ncbi:hypothetical protein DQ04_00301160 [Trypanosoma grayi]|uniref:hypothetical protein n=1 Tax=Trypanosoma grayi TaxID=71804 RepID=UPI0004F47916|nr:hypothetical protein DQ04_00301160 [Trypanosoma grayi]KEG14806.1 hypothetical protein DQ04_00301160 [Trypanosoma grayi]
MQQNRGEYLFRSSSPLHSGGLAPAAGSMTTSPSSLAHLNNPYMQSFNQGTTGGTGRPSAVVRRAAPTLMTAADTLQEQGSKAPEERAMLRSELSRGCESPAVETNERQTEVHRTLELQRLLRVERGMRLSAERRILEEREKGTRAAIVIEANYGARMLYSIFLEAIATLPSARTSGAAADAWDKAGRPLRSPSRRHLLAPSRNGEEAPHAASALAADDGRLAEENRLLRAQVERYRSIETEDRQELNELHRNMQTAIDRLTRECEALHTELTRYKTERQPLQWAAERGRVVPTDERSMWHYAHFIDPSAANMEESPELACRLRVLPLRERPK